MFIQLALIFLLICCFFATSMGLPGNYGMMLILVVFGLFSHFTILSMTQTIWLVGALILGEIIEFLAGMLGIRREKGGIKLQLIAVAGGIIGGMLGSGIFPVVGSLLGVLAGVFAATYAGVYYQARNTEMAQRIAWSAAIGQFIGTSMKVLISLIVVTAVLWILFTQAGVFN